MNLILNNNSLNGSKIKINNYVEEFEKEKDFEILLSTSVIMQQNFFI